MKHPRRFRRFLAAVLDGPAPTDLDSPFVVRELLRRFLEDARPEHPQKDVHSHRSCIEVSECLAGAMGGFGPPSAWRTNEGLGRYVLARAAIDISQDDPEDWAGLSAKINGMLCWWHWIIHDLEAQGPDPAALERSLDYACSMIAGTLDATHPGLPFEVASFTPPAAPGAPATPRGTPRPAG